MEFVSGAWSGANSKAPWSESDFSLRSGTTKTFLRKKGEFEGKCLIFFFSKNAFFERKVILLPDPLGIPGNFFLRILREIDISKQNILSKHYINGS